MVETDTVIAFKYRLDKLKHWSHQDVLFDFKADLAGTGSVPICIIAVWTVLNTARVYKGLADCHYRKVVGIRRGI